MTNGVSSAPPPKGPSAQGPSTHNASERANAADRFRAALGNAKSSAKPPPNRRPTDHREARAKRAPHPLELEQRPEGLVVIGSYPYPFSPTPTAGAHAGHAIAAKVHRAQIAAAATESAERSQREEALAIENVRVGRAGETVRVHATVSHGEHQGVELRAVSKDGRVEVELRAADSDAAQRLRAEMGSLRDALDAQGIERVRVSVVDASGESRGAGREHSEGQRQEQRERERASAQDRGERAEGAGGAGAVNESDDEQRELRDAREYLL
jgi:hypothetical protein